MEKVKGLLGKEYRKIGNAKFVFCMKFSIGATFMHTLLMNLVK